MLVYVGTHRRHKELTAAQGVRSSLIPLGSGDAMGTSSGDGKGNKPVQSTGDLQGLMLLARQQSRPLVLEDRTITLPPLNPPSLEGLKVATPAIAPVTPEELYARFQELREQAAPRRELARGALVSE